MSVTAESLENQERDLSLENRGRKKQSKPPKHEESADAELLGLRELRERVNAVKATEKPTDPAPHCGQCFRRGWAAAVEAIEGARSI